MVFLPGRYFSHLPISHSFLPQAPSPLRASRAAARVPHGPTRADTGRPRPARRALTPASDSRHTTARSLTTPIHAACDCPVANRQWHRWLCAHRELHAHCATPRRPIASASLPASVRTPFRLYRHPPASAARRPAARAAAPRRALQRDAARTRQDAPDTHRTPAGRRVSQASRPAARRRPCSEYDRRPRAGGGKCRRGSRAGR